MEIRKAHVVGAEIERTEEEITQKKLNTLMNSLLKFTLEHES